MELITGFIAFTTSITNVILTYLETTSSGTYAEVFNNLDYAACVFLLVIYSLKWYVATHRF